MSQDSVYKATQPIEFLHWFSGGAGRTAVDEMLAVLRQRHSLSIEPTALDKSSLRLQIKNRILDERSPDFWTEWPGANLGPYHEAGVLGDVSSFVADERLEESYVDEILELGQIDEQQHALPISLHRTNSLFYDCRVTTEFGLDIGQLRSPAEFIAAIEDIASDLDQTPLLLPGREVWPLVQLWESILLGECGQRDYEAVLEGRINRAEESIRQSLALLERFQSVTAQNAFHSSYATMTDDLLGEDGVFLPQGDWAAANLLESETTEYQREWSHCPFPGTHGFYMLGADAIVFPDDDIHHGTKKFLRYVTSPEGQAQFNRIKGGLPVNTRASISRFAPFFRDQMDDLESATARVPSIAHGLGVSPQQLVELKSIFADAMSGFDVDTLTAAIVDELSEWNFPT